MPQKIKPLLAFLRGKGKFVAEKRQVDKYFSPKDKDRDFLAVRPVVEWLRLRDADGKLFLFPKEVRYERIE